MFRKGIAWMAASIGMAVWSAAPAWAAKVTIPAGTVVPVMVNEMVTGGSVPTGQTVTMTVAAPVVVQGKTVIDASTVVIGQVQNSIDRSLVGVPGKVVLTVQQTTAVDGQVVPMQGVVAMEGQSKVVVSLAVSLLCPLALLMHGGEAAIAPGTQIRAIVVNPMQIEAP